MPYRAMVFDLFGTLVRSFAREEYDQVDARMAEAIGAPYPEFRKLIGETYHDRCLGRYDTIEDNIEFICRSLGVATGATQIAQSAQYRYEFTKKTIVPEQEALEVLGALKAQGLRFGLISNCAPDVPLLWERSSLDQLIDVAVFSCQEGIRKPDISIYHTACLRLQFQPWECIYVGDGSSQELTGAASAGLLPILKRTDLSDVYDMHRPEVENWSGLAVDEIRELPDMLARLRETIAGQ